MNDDRDALKQQVKEANDIVDVVSGYIPLRQVGPTFKGLCPFHDDKRPSFDVDPRRQRYRCWACSKYGDVFGFVMEYEHVDFRDALELLARRAGISLENAKKTQQGPSRAAMLDVMRWAQEEYAQCLLDAPVAEAAGDYLDQRGLNGETVRGFGVGFAPGTGEWLVGKAMNKGLSTEILETVGLIAKRNDGRGYYDRFRDRVMFPIRDLRGHVIAFGGRILPSSPLLSRDDPPPKYYNSPVTPIFDKSNQLYAMDRARLAAQKCGTLVVVEGYMDVLMAHQHGVHNVVAPMGTALTAKHVQKLRGMVKNVTLIFDADAGGQGGVDRALELFVNQELDLRIGLLPEGLDPCDLLVKDGAPAFETVLTAAQDVFEFKLKQVWPDQTTGTLEQKRAAVEAMLKVLSAAPETRGVKMELMVNRIAHRLGLKEETVWSRLRELRRTRSESNPEPLRPQVAPAPEPRSAPAARHEVELLELLLADPALVARAAVDGIGEKVEHPGLRQLLEGLLRLHADGRTPDLDHLREVIDNERLLEKALLMHDRGMAHADPATAYVKVLERFREKQETQRTQDLKTQVLSTNDHDAARALLARLRTKPDTNENKEDTPADPHKREPDGDAERESDGRESDGPKSKSA